MAGFSVSTMTDAIKKMEPMKKILLADTVAEEWNQVPEVSNYVELTTFESDASWAALNEGTDFSGLTTTTGTAKKYQLKDLMNEAGWNKTTLENKWLRNSGLPGGVTTGFGKYEKLLTDVVIEPLQLDKAKQLFVGDNSTTECQGLIVQLTGDTDRVVDTTYSGATGYDYTPSTIIDAVNSHISFIPENMIERDDLVMYLSKANYLMLRSALIDNGNLVQGTNFAIGDYQDSFMYPGALKLKIRKAYGLTGTDYMMISPLANLHYIYNILGFDNEMNFRFNVDYKQYRLSTFASFGATYNLADYIVTNF